MLQADVTVLSDFNPTQQLVKIKVNSPIEFEKIVKVMIVLNHTFWLTNQTPLARLSDFSTDLYDYRPNWTPLSLLPLQTLVLRRWESETWKFGFIKRIDIKVELPPLKIWKADVSSGSPSSERIWSWCLNALSLFTFASFFTGAANRLKLPFLSFSFPWCRSKKIVFPRKPIVITARNPGHGSVRTNKYVPETFSKQKGDVSLIMLLSNVLSLVFIVKKEMGWKLKVTSEYAWRQHSRGRR